MQYELLNIFPFVVEYKDYELVSLENGLFTRQYVVKSTKEFSNGWELLIECSNEDNVATMRRQIEEFLDQSPIYRIWQKSMPFLKNVPNIHQYRNQYPKCNKEAVNNEILTHGFLLSPGQILYRAGNFQRESFVINDSPISTSLLSGVALWHANTQDNKREIALLRVAEGARIKAFAYCTKGNQNLAQEYEILLQSDIRFRRLRTEQHNGYYLMEYEISNI